MSMQVNNSAVRQNSAAWNAFVNFTENKDDGVVVKNRDNNAGSEVSLEQSQGDKAWKFWRNSTLKGYNKAVQATFKNAVFGRLNLDPDDPTAEAQLPANVKKAMKLGDVSSGKPLTVRQIKAVKAAIEEWDADRESLKACQQRLDKLFSGEITVSNETSLADAEYTANRNKPKGQRSQYLLNKTPLTFDNKYYNNQKFGQAWFEALKVPIASEEAPLIAFCHNDGLFSFGAAKYGLAQGMRLDCNPSDTINHVEIKKNREKVVTKDGVSYRISYDIAVKQQHSRVWGIHGPDGKKALFDLRKPASCTTSATYHIEFEREGTKSRPVVSYKEPPTVKFKNNKPISEAVFTDQTRKYLLSQYHKKVYPAITTSTNRDTKDIKTKLVKLNALAPNQQEFCFSKFLDAYIPNVLIEESAGYTLQSLADKFKEWYSHNANELDKELPEPSNGR